MLPTISFLLLLILRPSIEFLISVILVLLVVFASMALGSTLFIALQAVAFIPVFYLAKGYFQSIGIKKTLNLINHIGWGLIFSQILIFFYQPSIQWWQSGTVQLLPFGISAYNYAQYFSLSILLFAVFSYLNDCSTGRVTFFYIICLVSSYHSDNFTAFLLTNLFFIFAIFGRVSRIKISKNSLNIFTFLIWTLSIMSFWILGNFALYNPDFESLLNGRGLMWAEYLQKINDVFWLNGGGRLYGISLQPHSQYLFWFWNLHINSIFIFIWLFYIFWKLPCEQRFYLSVILAPTAAILEILSNPFMLILICFFIAALVENREIKVNRVENIESS